MLPSVLLTCLLFRLLVKALRLSVLGGVGSWGSGAVFVGQCRCRPSHAPRRPSCAFLARFGWSTKENSKDDISRVGSWLLVCQNVLWQHKDEHGGG